MTDETTTEQRHLDLVSHAERLGAIVDDVAQRHHLDDPKWRPSSRPELETLFHASRIDIATLIDEVNLAWSVIEELAKREAQARRVAHAAAKRHEDRRIITPGEFRRELAEARARGEL